MSVVGKTPPGMMEKPMKANNRNSKHSDINQSISDAGSEDLWRICACVVEDGYDNYIFCSSVDGWESVDWASDGYRRAGEIPERISWPFADREMDLTLVFGLDYVDANGRVVACLEFEDGFGRRF
jgi:hypothetical protein